MTPEELLKAENAFIRLYNQGVAVQDIAERLGVAVDVVEKWRAELEEAVQKITKPAYAKITIKEKKETGEYTYGQSIELNLSPAEKLKLDLWTLSHNETDNEYLKDIIKQAQDYYAFAEKYLVSWTYKELDEENRKFNYTLTADANTDALLNKAKRLFEFYGKHVLRLEKFAEQSVLIPIKTVDNFSDYKSVLPYSIKNIAIENFQEINSCRITNIYIDSSWIFISGNNGYGKSTFLRAVAIGLLGSQDSGQTLIDDVKSKIAVEYKTNGENVINNLWTRGFHSFEHLACYGPSRLQIQAKMSQNEVAEKSTVTYGLFNPDGILLNIESKLIEWHLEKNERLDQIKALFRAVIPQLADIIVKKNEQDDYEVLYVERDEEDKTSTFDPVPFEKLAAGFRSIIGLVGDLLIRFIRKQPQVKQLSELAGIVLIDELENHLHPKWQYQLPTLLSNVFPNIQFIAATHSVIPILGAPKNSVFLKLNRSKENGITVERVEIDVANLLPNTILTSPIFDMDTIKPIMNQDIGQLRTEDTFDEVLANSEIDKQLRELDNDPSQYPALLEE